MKPKTLKKTNRKPVTRVGSGTLVSRRVRLEFMVVPELLATKAYVPTPVRCKIIDPEAIFLTGILGDSGRKLVKAGIEFYFTKRLANKLISKRIAVKSANMEVCDGGRKTSELKQDANRHSQH